jgi:hypothetical protein
MGNKSTKELNVHVRKLRLLDLQFQLFKLGVSGTIIEDEMNTFKLVTPCTIKFITEYATELHASGKHDKYLMQIYDTLASTYKLRYDALYNENITPYLDYMKAK